MRPLLKNLFSRHRPQNLVSEVLHSDSIKKNHGNPHGHKHKQILIECLEFLKNNGITVDDDLRRLIVFFFSADHHVALEDIRRFVQEHKIKISDSAIRDAFSLLVEYGFAIERVFGDNMVRYEHLHLGEHHDHFYCLKCGKIIEFYSPEIEDWQVRVAKDHEFHSFDHKMQIHGLCKQCFGTSKLMPLSKVETGGKFRIIEISDKEQFYQGCKMVQRMMEIGILPGTEGTVITNHGGRIVLLINNSRVALGRGMSQGIKVTLIE
ncbi:MAG: hypothetical protein GX267_00835 [Fibrobacter sp.]|jgi:Fur family ferric uptake transcriptional regulator|nr:hypothetical protein [Fibrobacter sp.]